MPLAHCEDSLQVVWPLLDLLAEETNSDPEMCRAVGELLIFALHTDLHIEDLWRTELNPDAMSYEAQWKDTNAAKFQEWVQRQAPAPGRRPSGLVVGEASRDRADAQAGEVRSGIVFLTWTRCGRTPSTKWPPRPSEPPATRFGPIPSTW